MIRIHFPDGPSLVAACIFMQPNSRAFEDVGTIFQVLSPMTADEEFTVVITIWRIECRRGKKYSKKLLHTFSFFHFSFSRKKTARGCVLFENENENEF